MLGHLPKAQHEQARGDRARGREVEADEGMCDGTEGRFPWLFGTILALSMTAAALGASTHLPITGDEPHYLVIAASVLRDLDFNVLNNYQEDATSQEIYPAPLSPHALRRETGWWPQHMPGLGVLLAIPFGLGGAIGARVGLAILLVAVLGVAIYRWNRTHLRPADAGFATLGVMACSPVVFGASQIYPDLPGGVAVFALVSWLWRDERRTRLGWCIYWCTAGFLCWLHVKYYAPSAVLAAAGAWRLWRDDDARFTPATYVAFGMLFLTGPALFGAFSVPVFGNMLGGRGGGELNTDVSRAIELVLGLHLDQVNGLFVQQPLFLLGLVAFGWMIRRRHPLTLLWFVLYASLIVPNALQQWPYGGHVAPAGRFGWSAMWLWLVPLGIASRQSLAVRSCWVVRLTVLAGIGYQAALAISWIPAPIRLFNSLFAPYLWQPSLFPPALMLSLPKLGPHADIGYLPNLIWTFAALALLVAGLLYPSRWRYLPAAATAAAALFVLPVEDMLERSRTVLRRYEAEHTPRNCSVRPHPDASNGLLCRQNEDHQFAVAGPYISLNPGSYEIVAALRRRTGPSATGLLQVVSSRGHTTIAQRDFRLAPSEGESSVTLAFGVERTLYEVEFRVRGSRGLDVDYIELRQPCIGERGPVRVQLQAANGQFVVSADNGGGVVHASRDVAGPREQFRLRRVAGEGCLESGDRVFLRTSEGFYLSAGGGGGSSLNATGTAEGLWEQIVVHRRHGLGPIRSGDFVTLQVASGHVIVAEQGGSAVSADGTNAGPRGKFRITAVP